MHKNAFVMTDIHSTRFVTNRKSVMPVDIVLPMLNFIMGNLINFLKNKLDASPSSVVMGCDSCSRAREFEPQHRILDAYFATLVCCKNGVVCLKKPKSKLILTPNFFKTIRGWDLNP